MITRTDNLHGFTCCACRDRVMSGSQMVFIKCSWQRHPDRMCRRCWTEIMRSAQGVILVQAELPMEVAPAEEPPSRLRRGRMTELARAARSFCC